MTDEIVNPVAWALGLPLRDEGFVGAFGLADAFAFAASEVYGHPRTDGAWHLPDLWWPDRRVSAAFEVTS